MWQKNVRYLDYNAGAPLSEAAKRVWVEALSRPDWVVANPSSRHRLGQQMAGVIYRASLQVLSSLGVRSPSDPAQSDRLVWTSSGTEANQTAIRSAFFQGAAVWIGAAEHSASHDLRADDTLTGIRQEIPLLPSGQYDWNQTYNLLKQQQLERRKKPESTPPYIFISVFWANHETGVVQDFVGLEKLRRQWCEEFPSTPIRVHLDAAQAWGKLPIEIEASEADWVSASGHKIGGPAGIGFLWCKNPGELTPLFPGSQNRGLRAGTENALGILALGAAAEAAASPAAVQNFQKATQSLRDHFERRLIEAAQSQGVGIRIWGLESPRVGNTSRVSFLGFDKYQDWVELMDLRGFALSHGSACRSQVIEPSRVLLNMGASRAEALNSVRISFGPTNSISDADDCVANLIAVYQTKSSSSSLMR